MDAPGSNSTANLQGLLKEVYAKPAKAKKPKYGKIRKMIGK